MSDYRAAGEPAARLISQVIYEAAQLDTHRRRLTGDNPMLANLLLGFEEDALRQAQELVRNLLADAGVTAQEPPPGLVGGLKRLKDSIGLFVRWKRRRRRRLRFDAHTESACAANGEPDVPSGPIVEGEVLE